MRRSISRKSSYCPVQRSVPPSGSLISPLASAAFDGALRVSTYAAQIRTLRRCPRTRSRRAVPDSSLIIGGTVRDAHVGDVPHPERRPSPRIK